jgi:hypothetical protein
MTAATIISIISAVLTVTKWLVGYAEQQKWMAAGAAAATLKGLQDADNAIKTANEAREAVRADLARDPARLRNDDEFSRPD